MSRFSEMSLEDLLAALREDGWAVICHNDYRQPLLAPIYGGQGASEESYVTIDPTKKVKMTFWSFGHEAGVYVKGEAPTDTEAVRLCAEAAHAFFAPSP